MKDSKGRDYDGWVLKNEHGSLLLHTFRRRRADALQSVVRFVRERCKAVKVLLLEVGD